MCGNKLQEVAAAELLQNSLTL